MIRTFRYPMKPTAAQEVVLDYIRLQCKDLYNAALQQRRDAWRKQRKTLNLYDQQVQLTQLRKSDPAYQLTSAWIQRSALQRLDKAYKAFFRRVKNGEKPGFPRFKGHARYHGFSFPPNGATLVTGNHLQIPSLGPVKLHLYRPIQGKPLEARVTKDAQGKWWCGIVCDLSAAPDKVEIKASVGVDVGVSVLATYSDGSKDENPRFYKASEEILARRQRVLSRKKRGSNGRRKAKALVAKIHAKIRNQRLNHARHWAKSLCDRWDLVCIEGLSIRSMIEGSKLAKSINDASWNIYAACLKSRAEKAGKLVTEVDPRGTSQECSGCGATVKKELWDRVHDCPYCGLILTRDHNAAINIHVRGLRTVSSLGVKIPSVAES